MGMILISTEDLSLKAELKNTPTARAIEDNLPLEGRVHRWGDEIYFDITMRIEKEPEAREVVEIGDLGYWPAGPAFCIFFGPTPVSQDEEPRAYSPVNIFGRVLDDAALFKTVADGAEIKITLLEE